MKSTMITATILASSMSLYGHAQAQEAPWGCEVLLFAASSAPSWHGVSYCVRPMTKLIAAMKLPGFSWPICPGAGTGAPGIEVYEECPVGYRPMKETDGNGRGTYGESCFKPDVCSGHGTIRIVMLVKKYRGR